MESVKFGKGPFRIGPVIIFLRKSEVSYRMICEVWEDFGYNLGLNEREMEHMRGELSSGSSDLWNMPREILRVWQHGHGDHANLEVLYQALKDINLNDLARLIRETFGSTCSALSATNSEGLPLPATFEQMKKETKNSKDLEHQNDSETVDLSAYRGPSLWPIMATSSSKADSCIRRNVLIPDFPFRPESSSFTIHTPPFTLPQPPSPSPDQALFVFPNQDHTKTLVMRSLGPNVCPNYVRNLFLPYGSIKSLRVLWERDVDTIVSIEFEEQQSAAKAMSEMDKIERKYWEDRYKNGNVTTVNGIATGFTIFVGNATCLTDEDLMEAFKPYGKITDLYMVRGQSYGFVTFANESSAREAIIGMNGAIVKTMALRVNWAYEKKATGETEEMRQNAYEKISKEASPEITTIYCSFVGQKDLLTEGVMRAEFSQFGVITCLRYFSKGYGFITFKERISAIRAIHEKNGKMTRNGLFKVEWGKHQFI